jgi:hypothetical protein
MAVASAKRVSKPTEGSTRNSRKPALKTKPDHAAQMNAEVENNAESQAAANRGSSELECDPAIAPKVLSTEVKEFVTTNLPRILLGVMKGIELGNASGAKLLLDYCRTADAESDQEGFDTAEGISLDDLFGPDIDWDKVQHAIKHQASATAEAGIDVGFEGREPDLTIARSA